MKYNKSTNLSIAQKLLCFVNWFVHNAPVKWYKICLYLYKAAIVMQIAQVKKFVKFRKTKKKSISQLKLTF